MGIVFAEDQSEVGLELFLYGTCDMLITFWDREGAALGRLTLTLPDTPWDTPHAVAFRHEEYLAKIAALTAESTSETAGFGIEAITIGTPTLSSVSMDDGGVPVLPGLLGNYPNPFNPNTTIRFFLPERRHVRLSVFSLDGRRITNLLDETFSAGRHESRWNARDARGRAMPSGTYFYRLEAGDHTETMRMTLLK